VDLSLAAKLLACRLCHAATGCDVRKCCESCTDTCNARQNCYQELPEKELVNRSHILKQDWRGTMGEEVDQERLSWLINTPPSDINFRGELSKANEATIRAALEGIEGFDGVKVKETALSRQLKKLLETQGEQIAATATRQARTVAMDLTTIQAERDQQQAERDEQKGREMMIAQAHEVIGRIQAVDMIVKFGDVTNLVWLKEMKEAKIYKDLPNIGTWDNFCKYLGKDRHTVDQDLLNLAAFGENFLETCHHLRVGYRDLRKLRQLRYDGESFTMSDDGKTVVIEGESIALGEDAGAEIEAALEKLLVKNRTLRERNGKLEKDFRGAVKEETLSLESQLKTQTLRVQALEVYEPSETDREWSVKQMAKIEDASAALQLAIAGFLIDPRVKEDRHLQAKVSAHLQEAELALTDVRTRLDDIIDIHRG
jgi:hypothetical protein